MNPIIAAFTKGYKPEQILKFLSNAVPGLNKSVQKAVKSGYPKLQILKFLSRQLDSKEDEYMTSGRVHAKKDREKDKLSMDLLKEGAKAAALFYGTGIASKALGSLESFGTGSIPPNAPTSPPNAPGPLPNQGAIAPPPNAPISPPNAPTTPPNAPTSPKPNLFQKAIGQADVENIPEARKQSLQFKEMVLNQLLEKGKNDKDPEVKKILKDIKNLASGKVNLEQEELERFTDQYGKEETQEQENMESLGEKLAEAPEEKEEIEAPEYRKTRTISKGSEVITPDGIGTIKSLSDKKALIESEGKIKQIDKDKIITPPESISDEQLAKLYDDLIEGIEKHSGQQISRNVNIAGYDEDANELFYNPHGGDSYTYEDIPQDIVEELKTFLRKTSGQNFIGAWEAGTDSPIGAGMSALINRLRKERRESGKMEYNRKFKTIYDAFTPAREAKKRVMKAKREEEKRRKKEKR